MMPHPSPKDAEAPAAPRGLILPFPARAPAPRRVGDACDTVFAYWDRLRKGRSAPARAELDLGAIARTLPCCLLAQRVAPGTARLRLAGRRIAGLTGMDEPRGMTLDALFVPGARAELALAIERLGHGARARLALRADPGFGRPAIEGTMLLLPLADAANRLTHVLGVVSLDGTSPARTCRFDLVPGAARPLDGAPPAPCHGLRVIAGGRARDQADPAP